VAAEPFEPDVSLWNAWHPSEIARRLSGVDARWCVAAGWALDLFRGRQTREHADAEIAVPAGDFPAIREALGAHEVFAIVDGRAHAIDEASLAASHQTWVREPGTGIWRLDVMRERWDGDTWVCRRDPRVRRPGSQMIAVTADGIPYQQPEIALLFKAKHVREKDEADFEGALPLLDPAARGWLVDALELVHPGHAWIAAARPT
jgi:hypothetical protein